MSSVREVTFELFREHGMTTIFGNPGSTELPMLAEFPDDFRYVLGLQEAVAVGMADGYAQASGLPTHVNLHTAPGVGNGMGALFNAQANHSPVVVTAGQQVRAQITMQANLTNRDATRVVHPFVKWSFEPPRAQDVPHAIARAIHTAALAPKGPAFVSLPMDDWTEEAEEALTPRRSGRSPSAWRSRTIRCWSPAPTSTRAAAGTTPSPWPSARSCRCSPRRRPAEGASVSRRATRSSKGCCRQRSDRSPRRSKAAI
jgi:thiamine pyrophosphate-dependent acetolactate synthase large subunit-like protein